MQLGIINSLEGPVYRPFQDSSHTAQHVSNISTLEALLPTNNQHSSYTQIKRLFHISTLLTDYTVNY